MGCSPGSTINTVISFSFIGITSNNKKYPAAAIIATTGIK